MRLDPPLNVSAPGFSQTLVLSNATVQVHANGVAVSAWVDANTSAVHVAVTPAKERPVTVLALLDHSWRFNTTVNAGAFGNGWGGAGGSFCTADGNVASFVGIFPDVLHTAEDAVVWYHRNDAQRSDMYGDTMKQQGLSECGPLCWDPLTNRSFGAALVGDTAFQSANATSIVSIRGTQKVELAIAVASAQTPTEAQFVEQLEAQAKIIQAQIGSRAAGAEAFARHAAWWQGFFNRSYLHVVASHQTDQEHRGSSGSSDRQGVAGYERHDAFAGDQKALMRNTSWPAHNESPGNCTAHFRVTYGKPLDTASLLCVQHAAKMCSQTKGCASFALSPSWQGGYFPQTYTDGVKNALPDTDGWVLFVNTTMVPTPPAPPPLSPGFVVSRQNVLMRYMDVCSSGRIGGGLNSSDYFALKYNGGILTSEAVPKEDYRAWGPGQWWQNLRLPYYTMLASSSTCLSFPSLFNLFVFPGGSCVHC